MAIILFYEIYINDWRADGEGEGGPSWNQNVKEKGKAIKTDRKSGKEKLRKEKENINFLEIKIEFVVHKKNFLSQFNLFNIFFQWKVLDDFRYFCILIFFNPSTFINIVFWA